MAVAPVLDLTAARERRRATWASGDYAEIGTLIVPIAERLADAADLRAGSSVLDVACGSGNMAIAAARLGCVVTGVDYVGSVLERAEQRAAVERLDVAFAWGDAEELPFADSSFDAATSVMGSMFAPDHERAAAELVRVTRRDGTIALASWTPVGFLGAMFWTIAEHVPLPAGVAPPMLWGAKEYLEALFGERVAWAHRRRTFTFRFRSAELFVDRFASSYGPTIEALEAAGSDRAALLADLRDLAVMWNRLEGDGPIAVPATYLESVGVVR
jgi:ubiquinone/menaquinone biosynthesis C-methylase UbiE